MFTLNYICENCNRSIRAQVTDGRVHPPPDICVECSNLDLNGGTGIKRRKKQVGDVVQGLLLEVF